MNHAEVRSKMADYLEGDLDLMQRALLDAHLDGCASCSGDFAEMRGTIAALRSLPDPEPPPFLVETVMRRIREGEGRRTLADRLRDFAAAVVTPPIAVPATALGLGLLMATGIVDPTTLSISGLQQRTVPGESLMQVRSAAPPVELAARGASPRPAAGRAPRIRISLPPPGVGGLAGQNPSLSELASNAGTTPRSVTRWAPRSLRTNVASNPLTLPVSSRVQAPEAGLQATSAFETRAPGLRGGFGGAGLDQLLEAMIEDPVFFSGEFASRSIPEQEHWLRSLAAYAHELGRDQEALASLRAATDLVARQVSTAFAAELRRLDDTSVVAAEPRAVGR